MIGLSFRKTFDWAGKSSRKEAWLFAIFSALVGVVVLGLEYWLANGPAFSPRWVFLASGLLIPTQVALAIRRSHDAGHSGRWLILALIPYVSGVIVLYLLMAPSRRNRRTETSGPLLLVGICLVAAVSLVEMSRVFWQPFRQLPLAMSPTLLTGDYFIATRPFGYLPDLGDVIVFYDPSAGVNYVRRVVGLSGDSVKIQNGILILNGKPVPQSAAGSFETVFAPQGPGGALPHCSNEPVGLGGTCVSERSTETLPNDRSYDILGTGTTASDNTPEVKVPEGQYFVMGDNRDNSNDSRIAVAAGGTGLVPADNIVGRVDRVIFSAAGSYFAAFWDWRPERLFKAVQ